MPLGASDRSLIQYVKDIEDKKNNAHFILCKNYSGDHPNAPDMSGTVRWVRGGVTREYSIVFTHTHTHTWQVNTQCNTYYTWTCLILHNTYYSAELKQCLRESLFDQTVAILTLPSWACCSRQTWRGGFLPLLWICFLLVPLSSGRSKSQSTTTMATTSEGRSRGLGGFVIDVSSDIRTYTGKGTTYTHTHTHCAMCVYPLSLILFIHALLPPDSQQKKATYIVHTHYISLYTHACVFYCTLWCTWPQEYMLCMLKCAQWQH